MLWGTSEEGVVEPLMIWAVLGTEKIDFSKVKGGPFEIPDFSAAPREVGRDWQTPRSALRCGPVPARRRRRRRRLWPRTSACAPGGRDQGTEGRRGSSRRSPASSGSGRATPRRRRELERSRAKTAGDELAAFGRHRADTSKGAFDPLREVYLCSAASSQARSPSPPAARPRSMFTRAARWSTIRRAAPTRTNARSA